MKKLPAIILIAILCLSAFALSACDGAILTAEDMLTFCNDSIALDPFEYAKDIVISANLYSVAVHNVSGDKVTVDFAYHDKTKVTATVKDSTLFITQESTGTVVHVGGTLCLVVGIPESWTNFSLGAQVDVGTLSIEDSKADNIEMKVKTGSARVSAQDASFVSLESDTGAINFQGKTDVLCVEVDTGSVKLEGQAGAVKANTDTGAIKVDMLVANLDLSTDTGSIVFDIGNNLTVNIESGTGSVRGTIDGVKSQYTITVDVDTGSCNVQNQTGDGVRSLTIDINTGSAKITFEQ